MGTRTISITDAAYSRLAQQKRPGESFTDVILRLTGRRSLRELANLVDREEADALAEAIEAGRAEHRDRRAARLGKTP